MGDRRLSTQELARRAGISYGSAFELYHGRAKRFDAETLNRLCRALGVGVGDILEYVPDPSDAETESAAAPGAV